MDNLLTRDDTFLGVCEALGEDLRIPATLFRLGFAGLLFWNPLISIAAYLSLGALVALTRWLVPEPRVEAEAAAEEPETLQAQPDPVALPIAA